MGKKEFSLYRSGNDNYHYLEDRNCEFINDYKISAGIDVMKILLEYKELI